jgi:choline dehydrogenase
MASKSDVKIDSGDGISRRGLLKGIAAAGVVALTPARTMAEPTTQTFDYVVVGSGPGGGPLACNLAKAGYAVCLMEAGGPATDPDLQLKIELPIDAPAASADPRIAWEYFVRHYSNEQQQEKDTKYVSDKQGILYPRSSTIGGCTVHNFLLTVYPSNSDWEHIVNITGDESWAPDRMREYFQRLEQCRYEDPSFEAEHAARHGFQGWQSIEMADPEIFFNEPQTRRFMEAAESVVGKPGDLQAYLRNELDPNDYRVTKEDKEGLYSMPMSRRNGARWNVRNHVLATAAAYPNLTIMTNCLATRVVLDGDNTATGVEYMQGANLYYASPLADSSAPPPRTLLVRAAREVIISAGTFNSPQLLKLSGIGSSEELSKFGIRTLIELPGVGTGMMDRYEVSVVTQLKEPLTLLDNCTPGLTSDPCFLGWQRGKGVYTTNGISIAAIQKSSQLQPDRDLVFINLFGSFQGFFPGWQNAELNSSRFVWLVLKAHTQNRAGTVMLRSSDPRDTPAINFHYFEEGTDHAGKDLAAVVDGIRTIRRINAQISDLAESEVVPGPAVQTDAELANFVKNEAWGHHASCSNRMGRSSDPMAVVDSEFKVIGTRNLRVVDASVYPRIPGYYPMIPIMMMSEKASDVILADARSDRTKRG